MDKWKVYVAGITVEVEARGINMALGQTGLFAQSSQEEYIKSPDAAGVWIYRVWLNGKWETAVLKQLTQQDHKYPHRQQEAEESSAAIDIKNSQSSQEED